MKNLVTTKLTLIIGTLLMMMLSAGISNAQVIEPPPEGDEDELAYLPLAFNIDSEDIDWEGYTFLPFEGAALERIENPDQSGINDTGQVLQYIKAGGQPWAGFYYRTESTIDITDETTFSLKVWSHTADVQMMLKLEMDEFSDIETPEMFQDIPASGEWVEIEWDLSGVDRTTPWDRVVIIADLAGPSGDGSDRFTWFLDDFNFSTGEATSSEVVDSGIPQSLQLNQNYPNPFNPTTNIEFALPESSHATLEVFDMLGQRVATLVDQTMSAGQHSVNFDASNLSSGIYIYRIQAGNSIQTRKLTLIK